MPPTLRKGDRGADVERAQMLLNDHEEHHAAPPLEEDGIFGSATERAVEDFQHASNILVDGIIGPVTWEALGHDEGDEGDFENGDVMEWEKVPAHVYGDGYTRHTLREDVAKAYMKVYEGLDALGGKLTSSGSKRNLTADVSSNRSATSLHYIGRAFDLFVYSGMHDLDRDPYLIEPDPDSDRHWLVWARVETGGEERMVNAWHHPSQSVKRTSAKVVNFTEIAKAYGFERIPKRSSYKQSNYGAAEWWHFQNELGLIPGSTTWGSELLKLYTISELEPSPPWKYRNGLWKKDWF